MLTIYQKTLRDSAMNKLDAFKTGSWLYIENPDKEEIARIAATHSLEEGLLHDAIDEFEVPRTEVHGDVVYIFTRFARQHEGEVTTSPILIIIAKSFIATVSRYPLPFFDKFTGGGAAAITTQKTKLLLQLFSEITAVYTKFLTDTNKQIRRTSIAFERINNKDIIAFINYERILNEFVSDLIPTQTILTNLLSGKVLQLYEDDKDLAEDLMLSHGQLIELCKSNLKTIVNIRDAYSTIMSNNINRVMRILTVMTIVLTVPTLIASIFGMNVELPFSQTPHTFWIIIGTILLFVGSLLVLFRRNRWL